MPKFTEGEYVYLLPDHGPYKILTRIKYKVNNVVVYKLELGSDESRFRKAFFKESKLRRAANHRILRRSQMKGIIKNCRSK